MGLVDDPDLERLKFGMPDKRSAKHHLEPSPVAFRADYGMKSDKTATGLDIATEGKALRIGIKHVVVRTGKQEKPILFKITFREDSRVVRDVYLESLFGCQLLNCRDRAGNVIMHIALSVLRVNEDLRFS